MPGTGLRLLIVDDQELFAMTLATVVTRLDYDLVGSAATADRAIELARDAMPDVVLMDLHLKHGQDGVTTAGAIAAETGAQIVFLTGNASDRDVERMRALDPAGILLKPFRRTALADALERAAARARALRAAFEPGPGVAAQ